MLGYFGGFWDTWNANHKIRFDPINRYILINSGVVSLNVKTDLYSDWKEWCTFNESNNLKCDAAIRTVGGDAISASESLGDTYFLINGWKIKPWDGHKSIVIEGNIYSDDGLRPIIPDNNSVDAVSLKVSALTNSVIVDTSTSVDLEKPAWVSTVGVTNAYQNGSTINISWGFATDNRNIVEYNVYVSKFTHNVFDSNSLLTKEDGYFYTITGLDNESLIPDTTYYIGVRAVDPSGNETENTNYATVVYNNPQVSVDPSSIWEYPTRTLTVASTSSLTQEQHDQLMSIPTTVSVQSIIDVLQNNIALLIGNPTPESDLISTIRQLDSELRQVLDTISDDIINKEVKIFT